MRISPKHFFHQNIVDNSRYNMYCQYCCYIIAASLLSRLQLLVAIAFPFLYCIFTVLCILLCILIVSPLSQTLCSIVYCNTVLLCVAPWYWRNDQLYTGCPKNLHTKGKLRLFSKMSSKHFHT